MNRQKKIYKSYDLAKIFSHRKHDLKEFLGKFTEEFLDSEMKSRISYSTLQAEKLDKTGIVYYYHESDVVREANLNDFIADLARYYPHIAAWNAIPQDDETHHLLLDNFEGEVTDAWLELEEQHEINVYPNGDSCNKLISAADLILRFIEISLKRERGGYLHKDPIDDIMDDRGIYNYNIDYVGHGEKFKKIIPRQPDNLNLKRFYPEPMFYILLEDQFSGERDAFRKSNHFDNTCELASKNNSAITFLNTENIPETLDREDYLIFTGEETKEAANRLQGFDMGRPLPVENIRDMVDHSEK